MRAIDLHQHLWPEGLIRALERRREAPRLAGGRLELPVEGWFDVDLGQHDLDRRLALLDRNELDVALVSLQPTLGCEGHPELRAAYREGILELGAASGGRIVPLAPGDDDAAFAGACLGARELAAGADVLLDALERAGRLLFVHPDGGGGAPPGAPPWWAAVADYTTQMQTAYLVWLWRDAPRFPRLRVVFSMLAGGGLFQLERLRSRGVDVPAHRPETAFFELSSYGPLALALSASAVGATQLVFGSDVPVIQPDVTLAALRGAGEDVAALVLRENPARAIWGGARPPAAPET